MKKWADLHIHTNYSDSTDSPQEVVQQAHERGLHCIAITDHDIIDGVVPALQSAAPLGIEVIPGIELSTNMGKKDIHMLGYLVDYANEEFKQVLGTLQQARLERIDEMIEKLKALGIKDINPDEVGALTKADAVGRPHLAEIMVRKGVVRDIREAFDKYLAEGQSAFVPKKQLTPVEGVQLIKKFGGLAVMAHPMITNRDEIIPKLVAEGLDGIEVYYPNAPINIIHYYEGIARKHNLLMTGGSDAHGDAKRHTWVAKNKVPYEIVEQMKKRQAEHGSGK